MDGTDVRPYTNVVLLLPDQTVATMRQVPCETILDTSKAAIAAYRRFTARGRIQAEFYKSDFSKALSDAVSLTSGVPYVRQLIVIITDLRGDRESAERQLTEVVKRGHCIIAAVVSSRPTDYRWAQQLKKNAKFASNIDFIPGEHLTDPAVALATVDLWAEATTRATDPTREVVASSA